MASHTITLTATQETKLTNLVTVYNERHGTAMAIDEYILFAVKEQFEALQSEIIAGKIKKIMDKIPQATLAQLNNALDCLNGNPT